MTSDPALLADIQKLKAEIWSDLLKARTGNIIDISKLPDRLHALHNRVIKIDEENRPPLAIAYEEVLGTLDELSREIQQRYNDISDHLKVLDSGNTDKKE